MVRTDERGLEYKRNKLCVCGGRHKGWTGVEKKEKTVPTTAIGSHEDPVSESVPWVNFFFITVNISN